MKKFYRLNFILIVTLLSTAIILVFVFSGCSITSLFNNFNLDGSYSPEIVKINLDENEIKNLEITNKTIQEKIDAVNEIKISNEGLRDPFMPFFINSKINDTSQKNMLIVERIYSELGVFFVEINFNEAVYKLKSEDLFGKIYQVKAINVDSVVLLKGDEIITLFISEVYYD